MNNRNTYLNGKLPTRVNPQMSSKLDRTTFNLQNSVTKNQPEKSAQNIDRMCTHILDILKKFPNSTDLRVITRDTLKSAGSKVFFDVIAIFLKSIDGHFKRQDANLDNILQFFKMAGYNGILNKKIFNPIGAPHTWPFCLALMEWIGELANFYYGYQSSKRERPFNDDINAHFIESYQSKKEEVILKFITDKIEELRTDLQDVNYSIDSKQLAIRNLQNTQKQVSLVDKDIDRQKQQIFRVSQQIISVQTSQNNIRSEVAQLTHQIQELKLQQESLAKFVNQLQYDIEHQQMTVAEVEELKRSHISLQRECQQIKKQKQIYVDQYHQKYQGLIKHFRTINQRLKEADGKYRNIKEIDGEAIELILPTLSVEMLERYMVNIQLEVSEETMKKITEENSFKIFQKKQEELHSRIQAKIGSADEQISRTDNDISELKNRKIALQMDIKQKHIFEEQEKENIKDLQRDIQLYSKEIQQKGKNEHLSSIQKAKTDNHHHIAQQNNKVKQQIEKLGQLLQKLTTSKQRMIKEETQRFQDHKMKSLQILERHKTRLQQYKQSVKNQLNDI